MFVPKYPKNGRIRVNNIYEVLLIQQGGYTRSLSLGQDVYTRVFIGFRRHIEGRR